MPIGGTFVLYDGFASDLSFPFDSPLLGDKNQTIGNIGQYAQ